MKKIKIIANVCFVATIGLFTLTSCEADADNLGSQFLDGNAANGLEFSYPVIAYNIDNKDSIRSDAKNLTNAILGAFDEPVFGMHKAAYVTQLRPSAYGTDFGTNPKVDSVVLQILPSYVTDSVTTTTTTINKVSTDQDSTKTVNTYPLVKYGRSKIGGNPVKFKLSVAEVSDFLYDNTKTYFSNQTVTATNVLGSKNINAFVSGVKITKVGDNTELLSKDPGIRIQLDKNFFQNKIIAYQGKNELSDAASFIRHFRGLRLSVDENDGFLFNLNPNTMSVTMYYSNDVTKDNTTTRQQNTYTFDLGTSNVHFSQFTFSRPRGYKDAMDNINKTKGDAKLYLQGAGGNGAEFVIPTSIIEGLRNKYTQEKAGILTAKIRLYSDENTWKSAFAKPSTFTVLQKDMKQFMDDQTALAGAGYIRVKATNLDKNPAYYDITITQTVKNIVEKDAENKPIVINVGDFTANSQTGALLGWNYTSRAYTPNRVVLVGTDALNVNKAQLQVIYTKK
ncbi:DUF4270 domain-containing protein [Elizabethkingia miricola]|uniref:DUF4270 domain-containing protein n=1 Tax=Elizabethkingia miricola TaxID=172045 RepID=UPI000B351226|nr:DUF4270 domain-containing protein [Elizabethkingia miricola]NHQ67673.1 DUF4270 domain-containing protein [Elizabethkingia miricola]NHQ70785.1 DUF4270 domain-containing protein [Elizabethkingia miricola]NHQ78128.1 DUF4270 domain-containing protein [Elizabethkingia miricola]PSL87626.1 DUF4270 domain-containing protein [Elizabethkingia miricola]QHQ86356.1 DUF4270 domain-containing protein [Elizabethkingia miricola]